MLFVQGKPGKVGTHLVSPDCKRGVEKEDTMLCPFGEFSVI